MSKAEERAWDSGYWTDLLNRAEYTANEVRDAFIEGYRQAEKDNELTWEDIKVIEELLGFDNIIESPKEYYQEVLKRFKERSNERPV